MAFKTWAANDILTAADVNAYLMRQVVAVVTSTARPSSPVYGQMISESDTHLTRRYNGTTWEPHPPQVQSASDGTNLTTSSTTFATGSPVVDFTFKGPPGGKALVTVGGHIEGASTSTAAAAILTFQIRVTNSAGAIVTDADDDNGIALQDTNNVRASMSTLVTGLTEGTTYYIRTMHRSTSAGDVVTMFYRRLIVQPLAN